jgi:IclR family KDG regulon transcriptional repressor
MVAQRATTLGRGLDILIAVGSADATAAGGLGVVRIAELVGREKSQVSRALKTLLDTGLVERDPGTRAYRLGWRLYAMAAGAGDARLLAAARPVLHALVARVGESAHLSVLDGTDVLTVLSEAPASAVRAAGWVGRRVPAHCTSSGRALLLDEHDDALRGRFAGVAFGGGSTGRGPRDVEDFLRRVAAARARGYAVVDEELEPGLVGAAAPVRAFDGRVVAAINVSAPKFRLGRRLEAAGRDVRAAAAELSARLRSA